MLKLTKRGKKGIFHIVGSIAGERCRESTRTNSEPHAQAKLAQRQQRNPRSHNLGGRSGRPFRGSCQPYLAKKGGTLGVYDLKAIKKLDMQFGARRLADITDIDIVNFCADAYHESGPHGHDRQVYTPLIAIYRIAAKAQPPLCDLPRFQRPAKPDREKVAPATDQQLAQVLPHCSDRLAAALLLISFTGARASECCRLEEKDIDWERHEALLCETKNGESRMVPLPGLVYEALSKLKGRKGPIFGFKQRWSLNQAIAGASRRAGVPVMTSHKFGRHAFAARLLGQGHTLKEVQEGGGWKSYPLVAEDLLSPGEVSAACRNPCVRQEIGTTD